MQSAASMVTSVVKEELTVTGSTTTMSSMRSTMTTSVAPLRTAAVELGSVGKAELRVPSPLLGQAESLTSKSLISASEMVATLREDASNATQTGLEDMVDELRGNGAFTSVTEQAATLLSEFHHAESTTTTTTV
ncbi:hypothetical protein [Phaffia rhodozyma]|uniref:Uncharacterized protein n=1 Tax=Phaffia rhodozyma TaxID=264483 RepID=A0A0F7SI48_PHARH|nr:hypothetical protein [Phaffia rhodozyma]